MKAIKIITPFVIFLLIAGCNKSLNLLPKDAIADISFWQTSDDFKKAANQLYLSLPGLDWTQMDVEADIAFFVPNSVSNGTLLISETDSRYPDAYVYIRDCNKIIQEGENLSSDSEIRRFIAEAKFFRGYNYWKLFRLYGGVPLITEVLDVNDEKLYTPRASRSETVDLILKDLSEAVLDLPGRGELTSEDVGRITKGAANALISRIALFEGTWEKFHGGENPDKYLDDAIQSSDAIMESGEFGLFQSMGIQSYRYQFIEQGDDSPESILARRYQTNISWHGFSLTVQEGHLLPTKKLADLYLCQDGLPVTKSPLFKGYNQLTSEFENRDPRMLMTILTRALQSLRPGSQSRCQPTPFTPRDYPILAI